MTNFTYSPRKDGVLGFKQGPIPILGPREWSAAHALICLIESMLSEPNFINFPETKSLDGVRRYDLLTLKINPEAGEEERCLSLGFEIKCSRSDFLNEMHTSRKYQHGVDYCDEFYFVTPIGLIRLDELPPEVGLIETYQDTSEANLGGWRHQIIRPSVRNLLPNLRSALGTFGRKAADAKHRKGFCALFTYFSPGPGIHEWLPSYQVGTISLPHRMQWEPRLASELHPGRQALVATTTNRRLRFLERRVHLGQDPTAFYIGMPDDFLAAEAPHIQVVWDEEHLLSMIGGLDWDSVCHLFREVHRLAIPELSITQLQSVTIRNDG